MIIVVARPHDERASGLIARWAARGAGLLTPLDLTAPGWCFVPGDPDAGVAVVQGRKVPVREIDAVLIRISCIEPEDLVAIAPDERPYVAAEINAFLIAWLDQLRCPVINRPRPGSLSGPPWTLEDWLVAAAAVQIPVRNRKVSINAGTNLNLLPLPSQVVNVVGTNCFGGSAAQQEDAMKLAASAGVECLAVYFYGRGTRYSFASADQWIDVSVPALAEALLRHVTAERLAVA